MSVSSLSGSNAQQVQPHMHRHHHKAPDMTNTAELLGMSTDDLEQAQKSGQTLTDLAASKGVSKDDLVAAIGKDIQANKPEGAPDLSDAQVTEMATNIADGKRPERSRPEGADRLGQDRSQSNLASLADELGVDQNTLVDALNSDGFDVSSLLQQANYSASASTAASSSLVDGLMVDRYV